MEVSRSSSSKCIVVFYSVPREASLSALFRSLELCGGGKAIIVSTARIGDEARSVVEKVRSGKIVVVATHILTGVERLAKGFAILHNGRVVARYPGEAVEVSTVVECSSRDASRIVEEAQKLNPSKIVVSRSAIYIHTTSTQQASSFVERFGCVAYPDIATMYSEVVKV